MTAAFTGLRMGELRALRWIDVDFANRSCTCGATTSAMPHGAPKSHVYAASP